MTDNYKILLNKVTTFIFDVDGVLSDGLVYLIGDDMARSMSTRDGYAMNLAIKKGYQIAVITGGSSPSVTARLKRLGVQHVFAGVGHKKEVLTKFMTEHQIPKEEILYMGDDLPDYHVMQMVGVGTCPKDACEEILGLAHYVSHRDGGRGCVRDVIEQTLRVQGKWFDPATDH